MFFVKCFLSIILVATTVSGCSTIANSAFNNRPYALRAEVAYYTFGSILGARHVYPIYRVPLALVGAMEPEQELVADLRCRFNTCTVVQIETVPNARSSNAVPGRLLERNEERMEAIIGLEPFPVDPSQAVYEELEFAKGKTKMVDMLYKSDDGKLTFQSIRFVGTVSQDPRIWK